MLKSSLSSLLLHQAHLVLNFALGATIHHSQQSLTICALPASRAFFLYREPKKGNSGYNQPHPVSYAPSSAAVYAAAIHVLDCPGSAPV